ncbi:recombinase family protein [Cyanobacterium stanieri LEGE 03274]|uniref:Recombinase family protein n=1 Tax=Cyanobacterium stanieri LEGE 03274 TaxID=1828756 RepID=A0ABR9V4Q2_9CHRO|nr:recombinase family protein [Cyanobacterium stanieri]MBE9222858.1 recombinase family protein [Cyanobacterium stanieri LEGE 03274]
MAFIITYTYTNSIIDHLVESFFWGLEVDKNYQDIDSRDALNQLFSDCLNNSPNYLLIRSLHELGDSFADILRAIAFIESLNIEIIAIDQPYNSSQFKKISNPNQADKLHNIWQEIEKIIYQRKLQKGHGKNRLKNLPPPGRSPYGYQKGKEGYIINRSTAPIIKDFFEYYLKYASLRDSVRYLKEKYNKKISHSTALQWLKNPVYRGDLAYKNNCIISNTHTPIISREEASQIDRLLKSHRRIPSRSASSPHCLSGLVRCKICNSPTKITTVTQRRKQIKYVYITPINCPQEKSCSSWNYQKILVETINIICQDLPIIVNHINSPDVNIINQQIAQLIKEKKQIKNNLKSLVLNNILDKETAQIRTIKIENEISQLNNKLNSLPPNNLTDMIENLSLQQFWYDLSEQEKRFYLREFIKKIYIIPNLQYSKQYQLELDFIFT